MALEAWQGLSYRDFMSIPSTRRYRMLQKKMEIEAERRKKL